MNLIIKITLMLLVGVVVQFNQNEAAPPSTTGIDNPTKGTLFDFFPKKAMEYNRYDFIWSVSREIKVIEYYISILETQKQNGHEKYDANIHHDLLTALETLVKSWENLKKYKLNCPMVKDIQQQIEKIASLCKFVELNDGHTKVLDDIYAEDREITSITVYDEINGQLPEIREHFLATLDGEEKHNYVVALGWYENKYSVFNTYYKEKLGIADTSAIDMNECKNFESSVILDFMEMLMNTWRFYYIREQQKGEDEDEDKDKRGNDPPV